jgi:hypothetical protein
MRKFLPSLTTITPFLWENKIDEIDRLGIEEIALFPTCLDFESRKKLYKKLLKTKLRSIPFTHLKDDMKLEEVEFLNKQYGCEVFNIHTNKEAIELLKRIPEYHNRIYVENGKGEDINKSFWDVVDTVGGICIDFAHFYDFSIIQKDKNYVEFSKKINDYEVGCCHLGAIKNTPTEGKKGMLYHSHTVGKLAELDYLKELKQLLPGICAIEVENSLTEQLTMKKYLESIL